LKINGSRFNLVKLVLWLLPSPYCCIFSVYERSWTTRRSCCTTIFAKTQPKCFIWVSM